MCFSSHLLCSIIKTFLISSVILKSVLPVSSCSRLSLDSKSVFSQKCSNLPHSLFIIDKYSRVSSFVVPSFNKSTANPFIDAIGVLNSCENVFIKSSFNSCIRTRAGAVFTKNSGCDIIYNIVYKNYRRGNV